MTKDSKKLRKFTKVGTIAALGASVIVPAVVAVDTVHAEELTPNPVSDFNYAVTAENTVTITGYKGQSDTVVIPDTINDKPVTAIGSNAFKGKSITKVVFPSTLTTIETYAFDGVTQLEEVVFNEGLLSIGNYAFRGTSLVSVKLPSTLTTLGSYAFAKINTLQEVDLNEGLTTIGTYAFYESTLTSIKIPSTVTSINSYAFAKTAQLTDVKLNEGLETIGAYAFQGSGVTSVTLPSTLKTMGGYIFSGANSLETVIISDGITKISDNSLAKTSIKSIVIPSSVETIGNGAFANNTMLETVVFNEGLKTIGDSAFASNKKLTEIVLPSTVETIGNSAFSTTSLESIVLNEGLTSIGDSAFSYTKLKKVILPTTVKSLGASAFMRTPLYSIELNEGLTDLKPGAFSDTYIQELVLPQSLSGFYDSVFLNANRITTLVVKNSDFDFESIAKFGFGTAKKVEVYVDNPNLGGWLKENKIFGAEVKPLSSYEPKNYKYEVSEDGIVYLYSEDEAIIVDYVGESIQELTIPETFKGKPITKIAVKAFKDLSLTSLDLSQAVHLKEIGAYAFDKSKLTSLDLSNLGSLELIGDYAFFESNLTSLDFTGVPELEHIGTSAFYHSQLETIDFSNSRKLKTIGSNAFGLARLTVLDLGNTSVTHIGNSAFYAITPYVERITLPKDTLVYLGEYSLGKGATSTSPSKIVKFVIPSSVKEFAYNAIPAFGVSNDIKRVYYFGSDITVTGTTTSYSYSRWFGFEGSGLGDHNYTRNNFTALPEGDFVFTDNDLGVLVTPTEAIILGYWGTDSHLVIPSHVNGKPVTKIIDEAFVDEKVITSVVFPNTLKEIGKKAFYNGVLTSVEIPPSVETIGEMAFYKNNIASLQLYKGLKTIGNNAFSINRLMTVNIPSTVQNVGNNAFSSNFLLDVKVFSTNAQFGTNVFKNNPTSNSSASVVTIKAPAYSTAQLYAVSNGHTFAELNEVEPESPAQNTSPSVIAPIENQTVGVNEPLQIDLTQHFVDADSDTLTYEVITSDDVNSTAYIAGGSTLVFRGFQKGDYTVRVKAYDGKAYSQEVVFTVTVGEAFTPVQIISSIGDKTLKVGSKETINVASLVTGDIDTYQVQVDNSHTSAQISPSGVLSIEGLSEGVSLVTVTVTGKDGSSVQLTFSVTVEVENVVLEPVITTNLVDGAVYKQGITPIFMVENAEEVTFTLDGEVYDGSSRIETIGTHTIVVKAVNGDKTVTKMFTFTIEKDEENPAPTPDKPTLEVTGQLPVYLEKNNTEVINLESLFSSKSPETLTYEIVNQTGKSYVTAKIENHVLTLEGVASGESTIQVLAVDEFGKSPILTIVAKVYEEVKPHVTPPTTESNVVSITITGINENRGVSLSTLLNSLDLNTTTVDTVVINQDIVDAEYDEVTRMLQITSKEKGFANIEVTARDEKGNTSTLLVLVNVVEQSNFGLNTIGGAKIKANEEVYIVPLNEVFGTIVREDESTQYIVGVVRKGSEQPLLALNIPDGKLSGDVAPALLSNSTQSITVPAGVSNSILYDDGTVKVQLIDHLLVISGDDKGEYDITVQAVNDSGDSSPIVPFSLEVITDTQDSGGNGDDDSGNGGSGNGGSGDGGSGNGDDDSGDDGSGNGDDDSGNGGSGDSGSGNGDDDSGDGSGDGGSNGPGNGDGGSSDTSGGSNGGGSNGGGSNGGGSSDGDSNGGGSSGGGSKDSSNNGGGTDNDSGTENGSGSDKGSDDLKELEDKLKEIVVEIDRQENGLIIDVVNEEGISDKVDLILTDDGKAYVSAKGLKVEVKLSGLEGFNEGYQDKRAVRLGGNTLSTVPHYIQNRDLIITSKNLDRILITDRVAEPFIDVVDVDWFKQDVEDLYNYIITKGTTSETYSPYKPITRGQFAVMIARALELESSKPVEFPDIEKEWYAKEVQALYEAGIVTGYTNGNFGGRDTLTRQQASAMIGRMLEYLGVDTTPSEYVQFADEDKILDYAKDYIHFLASHNILVNGENVSFNPYNNLTRAQMAKILMNALRLSDLY